jgi:hypothetical protein
MTHPADPFLSTLDGEAARTHRQLRLMKALFRLDDPEVERALTLIVERLAETGSGEDPLPVGSTRDPPLNPAG